jgi:antitoxin MazE
MRVYAAKWGNSTGMRFPKAVTEQLGIVPGDELDLVVEGRQIRLTPARRSSRQLLEELVAQARQLGPEGESETVDWGPDRGSEIIPEDAYSRGEISLDDPGQACRTRVTSPGSSSTR